MHEVGLGTFGINTHFGTPRNPYNDQHMTGGSSSGSAAAVAAGLVPLAIGCDGGGSIRIPAGLCGVVGLKATYMRIPFHFQAGPSMANVGPLAATVQDAALAYAIMAGPDASLPMSFNQPPPFVLSRPSVSLANLKIGVFSAYVDGCDPAIHTAYDTTVAMLRDVGASIVEVEIPHLRAIHLSHSITILTEITQFLGRHPINSFSPEVQIILAYGRETIDSNDFLAAQKVRGFAMQVTDAIFNQVDVFLTPTTASLAPLLTPSMLKAGLSDLGLTTALMRFAILGNMVGIPGISLPMAFAKDTGLPISMQMQAKHWNEHVLFDLARFLEARAPTKEPAVYYSTINTASV
ncbi:Aste57867_17212 [Aphanomyces stellatus]|uniref:Aste57867_17212 protein n=1 Tax=Aphanomyces stellatus TaxID=120398 RepID=A0A485L789_9STRA|nr:hypothetical protein As57867_017153 [Aphanomyces stellatus]VFT93969.1 Aste57867_17212 [Aphanomyces stellatus]